MTDIYVGILLIISVSILFFAFTLILSSKFPRKVADIFAIATMVGLCLYIYFLWDKAEVTWFVPFSNAIVVGNWFPIITAVLSALVYHRIPGEKFRKYSMVVLLNLVGFYALVQPIMGIEPECKDETGDFNYAIQSSQVSCSPTSAVNLLRHYEIDALESEMAQLCLTRESRTWMGLQLTDGGTSWMGLYRGLKLKLEKENLEPRFFTTSIEKFVAEPPRGQLIASLKLDWSLQTTDPGRFESLRKGGWQPGIEHNIVYLQFKGQYVAIVDPKNGYEELPLEDFKALWVGRGIYLERN